MSTPDPQADLDAAGLDAQPVYETDIWNPLAADGPLQVLHSRMSARAAPRARPDLNWRQNYDRNRIAGRPDLGLDSPAFAPAPGPGRPLRGARCAAPASAMPNRPPPRRTHPTEIACKADAATGAGAGAGGRATDPEADADVIRELLERIDADAEAQAEPDGPVSFFVLERGDGRVIAVGDTGAARGGPGSRSRPRVRRPGPVQPGTPEYEAEYAAYQAWAGGLGWPFADADIADAEAEAEPEAEPEAEL